MTTPAADAPQLVVIDAAETVWRVGFKPDPWAWSGWEWAAADGRFHGRWDDRQGNFRTIYAASSLLACLVELLADFRPDPTLALELDDIVEDAKDAEGYPTAPAGEVPYSWLEPRSAASATLTGRFCAHLRVPARRRPHALGGVRASRRPRGQPHPRRDPTPRTRP